jgi:ABC-type nitrate/sulfonate/bicarbonate transport system permease component
MTAAAAEPAVGRRRVARRRLALRSAGWLGVLAVAVAWQLAALALQKPALPTFTAALAATRQIVTGPVLTTDILPSLARALSGFAISALVGTTLGLTLGYLRRLGDYSTAVIDFLRSLPAPLLIPLAIVLLGLSSRMVVAVVVAAAVWPVLINAFDAARRTEPLYLDTARACGIEGLALLRIVLLPAALPMILAGLRIALSTSLAVLVVAEMLGASSGIGYFIQSAQQTFQIPQTYAGIIVLAGIGWLLDTAFLLTEHRLLRWERVRTGDRHA